MSIIRGHCEYCDKTHDLRVACPEYEKLHKKIVDSKAAWWSGKTRTFKVYRYVRSAARFLRLALTHGVDRACDIITADVNRAKYEAITAMRMRAIHESKEIAREVWEKLGSNTR